MITLKERLAKSTDLTIEQKINELIDAVSYLEICLNDPAGF